MALLEPVLQTTSDARISSRTTDLADMRVTGVSPGSRTTVHRYQPRLAPTNISTPPAGPTVTPRSPGARIRFSADTTGAG
jgi:hypothetical protein